VEQLNIVGKRSGKGFVAHKAMLVIALSRALAERVTLLDFTLGRRGLLGYLKALGGSNVVKVIPASAGSASGSQTTDKRLKIICGSNTSLIADNEFIGEKTPMTLCEVRVSPNNSVNPNVGGIELADALARVLPFTAKDDEARPVLACVNFVAKDGKLTLVGADGFRLALIALDCDGEGQALISRDNLRGIVNALKVAKRARISFEAGGETIGGYSLIIDTELTRYKWTSVNGDYPDYQKLIPTEFNTTAHFDTIEAVKAVNSLKALSDNPKAYPMDLTIGDGKLVFADPDNKGQAELTADTDGQGKVRVDGQYLAEALKACGGMVEFKLTNAYSPMLFCADGYQLVVMPMLTSEANEQASADRKAKAKATTTEPESQPEATEQAEPVADKPKGKRAKQAVTA